MMDLRRAADAAHCFLRGGRVPLNSPTLSDDTKQVIVRVVNAAYGIRDKPRNRGWMNGYKEKYRGYVISYRGNKAYTDKKTVRTLEITCPRGSAFRELKDFMDVYEVLVSSDRSKKVVQINVREAAKLELKGNWSG